MFSAGISSTTRLVDAPVHFFSFGYRSGWQLEGLSSEYQQIVRWVVKKKRRNKNDSHCATGSSENRRNEMRNEKEKENKKSSRGENNICQRERM